MNILAFAEQRDGTIRKSSFEAAQAAARLASESGGTCTGLVVGGGSAAGASALGAYGIGRAIAVDQTDLVRHSNTAVAKVIAEIAQREHADVVVLSASATGKDLAPRVAVRLGAGLAADCVAVAFQNGSLLCTRPVFAGKALVDVTVETPVKVITLRPNVFTATPVQGNTTVETARVQLAPEDFGSTVTETKVASGRPDVTEADIIVSGGRGMKSAEHFALIEDLADALGAAVGASRAVVDAGWRPHDEQVGQTGKTVAPTLYVACGISGAVQHLAGMSSSKYIVAINKDKDAPIFQVADYGIVGDLFEIVPELTAHVRAMGGK